MRNKFKDVDIKNHTYYILDDIINIKKIYPNDIKIDEKSYKNGHGYFEEIHKNN